MGIPKFFRYVSERYPLTSQLIQENKIPEFDNLYLDFNGIIHNCSHPNDADAHFRLSEEQIFTAIFTYVDHLFGKIRPRRLFFMAVDGVAPRAKMNQQRSRRFRTAKEAKDVREKAERKGEKLPDEKAFDSNCITPGTPFMARLSAQLRYFVNKKISEDAHWRGVEVVLSGHEVPGEGEHKIMEYIRRARAQPDYNPNMRHCLYGLDADLIMLGLVSHDPHFCLLREEVKFGPAAKKKGNDSLESINFYLLHLSLIREYLDLEFRSIAPLLPFAYSLERVIDDFVLLAVFVGNDFLPHLPDLHIHENGLERLFEVYKKVMPSLDGYINDAGTIHTGRLQAVLDEMLVWETEIFEKEYADLNWYKGKQAKHVKELEMGRKRGKLVLTQSQKEIFDQVKSFLLTHRSPSSWPSAVLSMLNTFNAADRQFIRRLAEELRLRLSWDEFVEVAGEAGESSEERSAVRWRFPGSVVAEGRPHAGGAGDVPAPGVEEEASRAADAEIVGDAGEAAAEDGAEDEGEWEDVDDDGDEDDDDNHNDSDEAEDEESWAAVERVLSKYEKAPVAGDDEEDFDARHERALKAKMDEWKRGYYKGKLDIDYDDPTQMGALIYRYVEGLQWVMHYYYSGVASWGWFYNYHYAPRISDLKGVDKMTFDFELGKPFRPFEQLMGVLPVASKDHIPLAYQDLMYDPNSPILDFYPLEFESDLNGKKQEWEAIVKIPFIDEKRLLAAMASREHRLMQEEKQRNAFGTSTKFTYHEGEPTEYPSSLPGFFPPIYRCFCAMEPFHLPTLDGLHLVQGLCAGVALGAEALAGFPSLHTLPHTAALARHGVNVHGSESRNESMVVHIQNPYEGQKAERIVGQLVGKRAFVGWPFLQEGLVVAASDALFKYEKLAIVQGAEAKVVPTPHAPQGLSHWKMKAERIEELYSKKCGVITGQIEVLLHVRPLKGLKRLESGAFVKDYEDSNKEMEYAVQMTLSEVASEDPRFMEREAPPLSEEFPEGSKVFFLGEHAYGVPATVSSTTDNVLSVILAFFPSDKNENDQFKALVRTRVSARYFPSFRAAEVVGLSNKALAKITSSLMVITPDGQKHNLGLSLKFEAKALKVIDYSRKDGRYWEFSEKAVALIRDYKDSFPELFHHLDKSGDAMTQATEIWPPREADAKVKEIKSWLKIKGVKDFEPVSLFSDQLSKELVSEIEKLEDSFSKNKSPSAIKKAIVKGTPRQAVLKPSHAIYRLQNQHFALGDRITMVQDSGGVPLSAKGVVVGLSTKTMDVLWEVAFMSGSTLGDRCSPYRGSTVAFNTCLNLSNPQFVTSTNPKAPPPPRNPPFNPRFGPHPAVQAAPGQRPAVGFRPAPQNPSAPIHIMTNPNRGRGIVNGRGGVPTQGRGAGVPPANGRGSFVPNGRGGPLTNGRGGPIPSGRGESLMNGRGGPGFASRGTPFTNGHASDSASNISPAPESVGSNPHPSYGRGFARGGLGHPPPRGGPGFVSRARGFNPHFEGGRGAPRGFRGGRGRGGHTAPVPS